MLLRRPTIRHPFLCRHDQRVRTLRKRTSTTRLPHNTTRVLSEIDNPFTPTIVGNSWIRSCGHSSWRTHVNPRASFGRLRFLTFVRLRTEADYSERVSGNRLRAHTCSTLRFLDLERRARLVTYVLGFHSYPCERNRPSRTGTVGRTEYLRRTASGVAGTRVRLRCARITERIGGSTSRSSRDDAALVQAE